MTRVRARSGVAATVTATLAIVAALWWGQRFLIPLTAGLMLAMLVTPLTVFLTRGLHSGAVAIVLTLMMMMGALAAGAMAFGSQLLSVADRAPEMISMVAQRLARSEHSPDSALARAHDSLQQLDRAADQMIANGPLGPRARRAAAAKAAGRSEQ